MRTCQKHDIESYHTDIDNEGTIILYDSNSVVSYINTDCELRLRAFNKTNIIKQNNKKMITVLECDDLSNMIFRKKHDSTNYLNDINSTFKQIKSKHFKRKRRSERKRVEVIHQHKINSHHENYFN